MNFDTLPHQLFGALLIGAETFVIAALWPLSEWATQGGRRWAFALSMLVIFACVALDAHGLAFNAIDPDSPRSRLAHALEWSVLPLFIAFPDAVCVASAHSLARAGVSARHARATALVIAAGAVVAAPFATIAAACGLAGACF
jgi:hypothetical protein